MAIKATVYGLAKTKKDIDINEQFRSLMTEVDGTGAVVIDGKNIAADSIYANQIKAGQINADHLRTDAITADHIQVGVVTGDKIKTGILESNNNLSWLNMDDGTFSFGGGRLTYNQNKLSITAEELYIGTSPVVTNDQLNQEMDKIESPDFENKIVGLSGNPIYTDKADDNSVVHVEVDGKSVGGGSGKNIIKGRTEAIATTNATSYYKTLSEFGVDFASLGGKKVSFSFDLEVSKQEGFFRIETVGSPWQIVMPVKELKNGHYEHTTTIPTGLTNTQVQLFASSVTSGTVLNFKNFQLELGDPTPYEPPVPTPDYPIAINSLKNVDVVSSVGKRNLLLDAKEIRVTPTTRYLTCKLSRSIKYGEQYTVSISNREWIKMVKDHTSVHMSPRDAKGGTGIGDGVGGVYNVPIGGSIILTNNSPTQTIDTILLYSSDINEVSGNDEIYKDVKVEIGDYSGYSQAPEDIQPDTPNSTIYKANISLPEPLRSVGDVKDRLFRDTDELWKVERRVGEVIFNGSESGWHPYNETKSMLKLQALPDYNGGLKMFQSSHFKNNTMGSSGAVMDDEIMVQNNGNTFIGMRYKYGTTALFTAWLAQNPVTVIYQKIPTIETLPDDLQQKLNNIQSYGVSGTGNKFKTSNGYEVNTSFYGYKIFLKPNRKYTMTTNIPDSSGVNYHAFFDTGMISPSHTINGVSSSKPRTIHTDDTGLATVAVRYGEHKTNVDNGISWINIKEDTVTNYVYTVVKPIHYEENLLEVYPILKDYWYSNVAPLDVPTATATGNSATEGAIPVFPNQQLLFEKQTTEGETYWRIVWVNSRGEVISRETPNTNSITMTAPAGAYGMRVSFPTESQASIKYTTHAFLPNSRVGEQLNSTLYATFKTEMWSRNWKLENYTKTEIENRVPIGQMIESIKKDPATARLTGERLHFTGDVLFDKSFHDKLFAENIFTNTLDAREISAARIKTGMLQSKNGLSNLNMDNGTFSFGNGKITYDGNNLVLNVDTLQIKSSSVPTTAQAQSYATNAVNDLELGGRNLLRNGNFYTKNLFDWSNNGGVTYQVLDGKNVAKLGTTSGLYQYLTIRPSLGVFTFSFLAKSDVAGVSARVGFLNGVANVTNSHFTLSAEWKRYSFTITSPLTVDHLFHVYSTGTPYYVTDIKVESGNKVSAFTNAPEDTERDIANAQNDATNAKGKTDAWTFTGTTEINGGKIRADTITAAQIKSGTITADQIASNSLTIGNLDNTTTNKINNAETTANLVKGVVTNFDSAIINANPIFLDWSSTVPVGYTGVSGSSMAKVVSGNGMGNAVKFTVATAGTNVYLNPSQVTTMPFYNYVTVEFTFKLESGTVDGAGVLFRYNGTGLTDHHVNIKNIIPNPVLNKWYTITKVIKQATQPAGFTGYSVFPMGGWSSFGSPTVKVIQFDSLKTRQSTEQEINAYESNIMIADMSTDGKVTPVEKVQLKKEWATISAERTSVDGMAATYGITTERTNMTNAYNTLNTALNGTGGILTNMTTTSSVTASTFRAQFDDYYDKKAILQRKINETARALANSAQGTADTANTNATNAKSKTDAWTYSGTTEINGGKIRTNTILANAINATTLSAITANLGTVTAGIVKSGNGMTELNLGTGILSTKSLGNIIIGDFPTQSQLSTTLESGHISQTSRIDMGNGVYLNDYLTITPAGMRFEEIGQGSGTSHSYDSEVKPSGLRFSYLSNGGFNGSEVKVNTISGVSIEDDYLMMAFNVGDKSGQSTYHYGAIEHQVYGQSSKSVIEFDSNGVWFPQGIQSIRIPAYTDLNSITNTGFYYNNANADAKTMVNSPTANAFSLLVERHAGYKQTLTTYRDWYPETFVRNHYNGTWGEWENLFGEIASIGISLQNGWKNFGGVYPNPHYWRDSTGMVHLRGMIEGGANKGGGSTIGILPGGYRPRSREVFIVYNHSMDYTRIDVNTDGAIISTDATQGWVSLSGVSFMAAR